MKTNFTLLVCALTFQHAFTQLLPNFSFNDVSSQPCIIDSSETVLLPDYWTIYQTQNDRWDGLLDSTYCIGVYLDGADVKVSTDDFDTSRPLFVRCKLDGSDKILLNQNSLFNAYFNIRVAESVSINTNEDCENNLCSGIIVGIEIPDSLGTGKNLRKYQSSFNEPFSSFLNDGFCYASEKFDSSFLTHYVLKLQLNSNESEDWIELRSAYHEEIEIWDDNARFYNIEVPEVYYQDTSYEYGFEEIASPLNIVNFLIMYNDTTYPSQANPAFVDISPVPNIPNQEWINLYIDYYYTLVHQPFAYLRGGLIEGSDSIRHNYSLINNGGDICMYPFIEFVFSEENKFIYQAGDVNFHGQTSCMMFRNGGELIIAENTFLQYGDGGEGILALGKHARVNLRKGSSLTIDNEVMLLDVVSDPEEEIIVDLQPGSTLTFGKDARILRAAGESGNQMINVYMNGGMLDERLLNASERAMIRKIYPEQAKQYYPEEKLFVFPNPALEIINVRVNNEKEEVVLLEIYSLDGKLFQTKQFQLIEGMNELEVFISGLDNGVFILQLKTMAGVLNQKFIKQ